jgi:hypothetical protein
VPIAAELLGELGDAAGHPSHLLGRASGPRRHRAAFGRDLVVDLCPATHLAVRVTAHVPALHPDRRRRPPEALQVDERDWGSALGLGDRAAHRAPDEHRFGLEAHDQRAVVLAAKREQRHVTEANEQLAEARSFRGHGGSPLCRRREPTDWRTSVLNSWTVAPAHFRSAA